MDNIAKEKHRLEQELAQAHRKTNAKEEIINDLTDALCDAVTCLKGFGVIGTV